MPQDESEGPPLTPGGSTFIDGLTADQRSAFDRLDAAAREGFLAPHARGFDRIVAREQLNRLTPREDTPTDEYATTAEMIAALTLRRDPALVHRASRALMLDLGDHQGSWPFMHRVVERVYIGELPAEAIIEPLEKTLAKAGRGEQFSRGMAPYWVASAENWLREHPTMCGSTT